MGQRADCCPDQGGEQRADQIFYRPGRKGKPCVNGIGQQKEGRAVNCQKEDGQAEGVQQQRAFYMAVFRQPEGIPKGFHPSGLFFFPFCPAQFFFKILVHVISYLNDSKGPGSGGCRRPGKIAVLEFTSS